MLHQFLIGGIKRSRRNILKSEPQSRSIYQIALIAIFVRKIGIVSLPRLRDIGYPLRVFLQFHLIDWHSARSQQGLQSLRGL